MLPEYEKFLKGRKETTRRSYDYSVKKFLEYFGVETVDDLKAIDRRMIKQYRSSLMERDDENEITTSSVNAYMRNISAFYGWMVDEDYINTNPMNEIKRLKEPEKIRAVVTDEELVAMINACDNIQDKTMLALMYGTGIRRGDVVRMKVSDLQPNLENPTHVKVVSKGDKDGLKVLPQFVLDFLKKHLENHTGEYLFVSQRGNHGLTPESVRLKVKNAAKAAGLDEKRVSAITPHAFRRGLATKMIDEGTQMAVIQKQLSHSDERVTKLYAKMAHSVVDNAVLSLTFPSFD